jgi:hypothetical protein
MITFLINIETTGYSLSGAQLHSDTCRARLHYPRTTTGQHVKMYRRKVTDWRPTEVGCWWLLLSMFCCTIMLKGKALAVHYAKHILRNITSSLVCRLYRISSYYHINRTIFGTKLLNIKCVFWFLCDLETFFFIRRLQRDIVIHVRASACAVKYTLLLSDFKLTWIFSAYFRRIF